MIYMPPYVASVLLGWTLFSVPVGRVTLGVVLDFAALAVIFAGVFIVSKYKAALDAVSATSDAWKDERDAAVAHAQRMEVEITANRERIIVLEQRPDLTLLQKEIHGVSEHLSDLSVAIHEMKVHLTGGMDQ